jgi:hypothetical protein
MALSADFRSLHRIELTEGKNGAWFSPAGLEMAAGRTVTRLATMLPMDIVLKR